MAMTASFYRDANRVPITTDGVVSTTTHSLTGNNTTVNDPIFTVTGIVEVRGLWGIVTTTLGSNVTAAYWRLNDSTAQSDITLSTGTALSGVASGSLIWKKGVVGTALTSSPASQERVADPNAAGTGIFSTFIAVQKTGGVTTNIEFNYTTTNTPTSGAIQFFLRWLPLSADANITPL